MRERTLLVEKAADGQGGVKTTKTGQARTVRLLAPLVADLAEWRHSLGQPDDDALLLPNGSGGVWNDPPGKPGTGTPGCRPAAPSTWRARGPTTCATASSRC